MWFDSEPLQSPILLFSYIPYTISFPLVCPPNIISNKKPLPKSVTPHIALSSCSMTFVITLIKQASIKLIGHLCPSINSVFQKTWDASFLISVMYGSFYIDTEWVDKRKKKSSYRQLAPASSSSSPVSMTTVLLVIFFPQYLWSPTVLVRFVSTWHKFRSSGKKHA